MKNKKMYAISVNKKYVLSIQQVDGVNLDIYEFDDISNASYFLDLNEAINTIYEICGQKESRWDYNISELEREKYNIDDLDIVEVNLSYRILDGIF